MCLEVVGKETVLETINMLIHVIQWQNLCYIDNLGGRPNAGCLLCSPGYFNGHMFRNYYLVCRPEMKRKKCNPKIQNLVEVENLNTCKP